MPFSGAPPAITAPLDAGPLALDILDRHPDPIIVVDTIGDVAYFNQAAAAVTPLLRAGRPLTLALRHPGLTDAVRLSLADGKEREVDVVDPVPVERAFAVLVKPLDHPAARLLITMREVSEQRRTERMRVDFVANVSHELRTPLASLLGFVETLLGPAREDTAARERFLGIMLAQARRMSRLIDDLLSLSRIEMNEHVPPSQSIDLVALVDDLTDTLRPMLTERGLRLEIVREVQRLPLRGDRDELIRLFENLIQNAGKYGADGGRITVSLAREGTEAVVQVRDYGPGIAPEHLPRLTERFYRVDVAQSRSKGGTGLGLAIVKHIINRHRGRLTITSTLGEGACFSVRLPLRN